MAELLSDDCIQYSGLHLLHVVAGFRLCYQLYCTLEKNEGHYTTPVVALPGSDDWFDWFQSLHCAVYVEEHPWNSSALKIFHNDGHGWSFRP